MTAREKGLRFGLHPWAAELMQSVESALEGETDDESRRAACYVLTLLLQSVGADALVVLPAKQLARVHRRLRLLRDGVAALVDSDEERRRLHTQACAALEELRVLGLALVRGGTERDAGGGGGATGGYPRAGQVLVPPETLPVRMP